MVPNKSSWSLVDYVWTKGHWTCIDPEDARFQLEAKLHSGEKVSLKHLKASESMELLGIYLSSSGNQGQQVQAMQDITERWADQIRVGYLRRGEVWAALQTTIVQRIDYPLPALTLSPQECNYIMAPVTRVGLPKAGIPSSVPKVLCHAPISDWDLVSLTHTLHNVVRGSNPL